MSSYHGSSRDDYRDRHSSSSSSRRRSSPSRHRSRRSPSPGPSSRARSPRPRDPKNLPESFGRVQEERGRDDRDDLNILQRMKTSYDNSPLASLYSCVKEKKKVKIWTRNYKEVRGVMTGYIIAFDKHWNLILHDVDEVYLKQKKCKTPFLREVAANENLPDMPAKVPKEKKAPAEKSAETVEEQKPLKTSESESESTTDKPEKKKRPRKKKSKTTSEKRQVDKLFIRGDNVVMICPIIDEVSAEEGEEVSESG